MKKIFMLLLPLFVLISCSKEVNIDEEVLVIHSTFEKAVYPMSNNDWHDANRFGPMFPPKGSPKFKITKDTVLRAGKHIYKVKDSLSKTGYYGFGKRKAKTLLEKAYHEAKLKAIFASFVKNDYDFQIPAKSDSLLLKSDDYNGELTFTRVVFNKQKTKACYYITQYIKRYGWGMGALVYAEKKHGKWIFVSKEEDWIV